MTSDQKGELEKAANENGQSVSDYVRAIISSTRGDIQSVVNTNKLLLEALLKKLLKLNENQSLIMDNLSIKHKKLKYKTVN